MIWMFMHSYTMCACISENCSHFLNVFYFSFRELSAQTKYLLLCANEIFKCMSGRWHYRSNEFAFFFFTIFSSAIKKECQTNRIKLVSKNL